MDGTIRWLRGLWAYYLEYTGRPVHAAAAAAFAIFGLLVFVDPLFAVLAVCAYLVPPVILYALEAGATTEWERRSESPRSTTSRELREEPRGSDTDTDSDGDSDSDGDDGDSDSDGDDGDSDSDSD